MPVDYIHNGRAVGSVADRLLLAAQKGDFGYLQPWRSPLDGRSYVTVNGKNLVTNASATLTRDVWLYFERALIDVQLAQLRVWGDLVGLGLTDTVPNALAFPVSLQQTTTDFGTATLSMSPARRSERDRPEFDQRYVPNPIVHSEFSFDIRDIAESERTGRPLPATGLRKAVRRCSEIIESLTLGTYGSFSYGGGSLYGLTNKPERITTVLTAPTAAGWEPSVLVDEISGMISDLQDINYDGPYGMYYTPAWSPYFNGDYAATYPGTLMTRLQEIEELSFIRKLRGVTAARNFLPLTGFQVILFEINPDVIKAVTGEPLRILQWDEEGGIVKRFKVWGIQRPETGSTADNVTGINHGASA